MTEPHRPFILAGTDRFCHKESYKRGGWTLRPVLARILTAGAAGMLLLIGASAGSAAGREPVLKQVDLPHSYYWRELYVPQLTTGPSSAGFTPDGRQLIYSMGGSLWRQQIGSSEAIELTHANGAYDYQPDVAPDGRSVVFTRYDGASFELWRLDLATGNEERLTSGGAVNLEPRLSPDGTVRLGVPATAAAP